MERRRFLKMVSAAIIPTPVIAERTSQAAIAASPADELVPLLDQHSFHRMPELPDPIACLCFAPDGRRLAVACQHPRGTGAAVYVLSQDASPQFHKVYDLPNARRVYSIAWEPGSERLAICLWTFNPDTPKPYQTLLEIVAADTGEMQTRRQLWAERNPIDKGGIHVKAVWLDSDRLLAAKEGSQDLYAVLLANSPGAAMHVVYPLPEGDDFWMSLATLDVRHVMAISARRSPRRYRTVQLKWNGETLAAEDVTYNGETILAWTDCFTLLASRNGFYRGFQARGSGKMAYVGEFVNSTGTRRLFRVPEKSPFATPEFNLFQRQPMALSPDGSRLALLESDHKREPRPAVPLAKLSPAERATAIENARSRPERNPNEPYGRLVIAVLPSQPETKD